jgi:hypothetical protein
VQVRPPQAAGDEQSEASGARGVPNTGVAPPAVRSHDAINLAAHRRLARVYRPAVSDLAGGRVITEK